MGGVTRLGLSGFVLRFQLLGRVLANRLQQKESRLAAPLLASARGCARSTPRTDRARRARRARRPPRPHRASKPPTKTASERNSRCSSLVEQPVAPVDRGTQRLLALGPVTGAAGEEGQRLLEPVEDPLRREQARPAGASSSASGRRSRRSQIAADRLLVLVQARAPARPRAHGPRTARRRRPAGAAASGYSRSPDELERRAAGGEHAARRRAAREQLGDERRRARAPARGCRGRAAARVSPIAAGPRALGRPSSSSSASAIVAGSEGRVGEPVPAARTAPRRVRAVADGQREPRLADPARTGERHQRDSDVARAPQLGAARPRPTSGVDEIGSLRRSAPPRRSRAARGVGSWTRIARSSSCSSGFGSIPELLDQQLPGRLVGGERLGLPPRPVEREDQVRAQPLAVRVRDDQLLELADELRVAARLRDRPRSGPRAARAAAPPAARRRPARTARRRSRPALAASGSPRQSASASP